MKETVIPASSKPGEVGVHDIAIRPCPHCGGDRPDPPAKVHVCADREPWTQAERDEWRAEARRRSPWLKFSPSTAVLGDRFGEKNRRDPPNQRKAHDG